MIDTKNPGFKYTDEYIKEVYDQFIKSGLRVKPFSRLVKISDTTLSKRFKDLNLEIPSFKTHNKIEVNDNYFKILNSESAYWLGFLLADGYVDKNYK